MLLKNALAQALLYSLLIISLPTLAMDAPKKKFSTTKTIDAYALHPFFHKPLKVQIQMQIPASARTKAECQTYYTMRAAEIDARLKETLAKYTQNIHARALRNHVTILPTELFFNAETSTLILRKDLKTHQLTEKVSGRLEVRIEASAQSQETDLKPETAMLYITPTGTNKKQLKLNLETLYKLYPDKTSLNLKPEDRATVWLTWVHLNVSRGLSLLFDQNQEELPDGNKYVDDLYIDDVKKMARHYLTHHMPNN